MPLLLHELHGQQPSPSCRFRGGPGHPCPGQLSLPLRLVVITDLIVGEDQCLGVHAAVVPVGLHAWGPDAESLTGSPDGVLAGAVLGPEDASLAGC